MLSYTAIIMRIIFSYTRTLQGLELKVCGLGLGLESFCKDSDSDAKDSDSNPEDSDSDSDLVDSTTSLTVMCVNWFKRQ